MDLIAMKQIVLPDCQELIEQSGNAKSVEEIHTICSSACDLFGFEQFMYGGRVPSSFVRPQVIIISGYNQDWWDRYNQSNYLKIDPVVDYCANNILPLQWHTLHAEKSESKLIRQLMNESIEFGLKSGLSFPVHTPRGEFAMLSFASSNKPKDSGSLMNYATPHLMQLAYHVHDAVMRIFRTQDKTEQAVQLTARERQCLLWAAEGKTADETAEILAISESTVRFHLNNAARKLNVHTRRHAIARAICLGLISPVL